MQNFDYQIDRYLSRLRMRGTEVRVMPLMNKDSLEMTDDDRAVILNTVRGLLPEQAPIVITHGTSRMVETGLYLNRALAELKVPIILTGAMTPPGFEGSDGLQNLTESLFAARVIDAGIYVVIHNQVFPVDRVRKDQELARFVWIDSNID